MDSRSHFRSSQKWECWGAGWYKILSKAFPKKGPLPAPHPPHTWTRDESEDDRQLESFSLQGFSRQSSLLFKILSSVRNHQINSDLAQLLLRLDYNKYYTQAGGTLGRYEQPLGSSLDYVCVAFKNEL